MRLFDDFTWRGMVFDATDGVAPLLAADPVVLYAGFDPTASSLHVGHLLPLLGLVRAQRSGHRPIALVGGGTAMVGDPSGKSQERVLLSREQVDANVAAVRNQLGRFLDFGGASAARLVNNAEWLGAMDVLSFLRDTGKHFTVSFMLQKESVSRRLEGEEGISFTEFSYLLLQAYDFLHLFERFDCVLQIGGSDQWGNITAGIDLVRKMRARKVHGLVWPLMTTASGVKFGKTEAGAVWLDPARTSPFRFYQFWLNTHDSEVVSYLKFFTFLAPADVDALADEAAARPEQRHAQRTLAREVTALVHGGAQAARAEHASSLIFSDAIAQLPVEDVLAVFDDVPSTAVEMPEVAGEGMSLVELLARVGLAPSKAEARRLVLGGGVYLNNRRASDVQARVTLEQAIGGRVFLLRKGQRQNHLVRVV
jgi:tyrosyl-tRNA synthetase